MVIDLRNVHIEYFAKKYNTIFLDVKVGDHVTLVSPPVFTWADEDQRTGTWCFAATTFHFVLSEYISCYDARDVGLAPLKAIKHKETDLATPLTTTATKALCARD